MATQWQPTPNIFQREVFGAMNDERRRQSNQRAWDHAMNSGRRRLMPQAARGNPRAIGILGQMGPSVRVGSAPDVTDIWGQGVANAAMGEEEAAAMTGLRSRLLDALTGATSPILGGERGSVVAPGAAGKAPLSASSSAPFGAKVSGSPFVSSLPDDTPGNASTQARSLAFGLPNDTPGAWAELARSKAFGTPRQSTPTFPATTASAVAPTAGAGPTATPALAPAQRSIFDIAGDAVARRKREQEEMGIRDRDLGAGMVERALPGGRMLTNTQTGDRQIRSQYGTGSSTPTPVGTPKTFGGLPGLSFFQEAANRQGIGNRFASEQANSQQNLLAAAMQQAWQNRTRR